MVRKNKQVVCILHIEIHSRDTSRVLYVSVMKMIRGYLVLYLTKYLQDTSPVSLYLALDTVRWLVVVVSLTMYLIQNINLKIQGVRYLTPGILVQIILVYPLNT